MLEASRSAGEREAREGGENDADAAYYRFFDGVRSAYSARSPATVEDCCRAAQGDARAAEYCSAATSLLRRELNETDDTVFLGTLPGTPARIGASNDLDLLLSDYEPAGDEPFALYYRRAWQLARSGNVRAAEAFVVMFENSHGVFAEAAEGSLCSVFRDRPELYGALEGRHRRAIRELRVACPALARP